MTVIAEVDCGAKFIVHLTPGACQSLALQAGQPVWLVLKTYSCHVLQADVAAGANRSALSSRRRSCVHRSRCPVMTLTAASVHTVHTGNVAGCCEPGWTSDHPEARPIRRICMKLVSVSAAGSACLAEVSRNANRRRSQRNQRNFQHLLNTRRPRCLPPKSRWRRSPPAWGRSS